MGIICGIRIFETCCCLRRSVGISFAKCPMFSCRCAYVWNKRVGQNQQYLQDILRVAFSGALLARRCLYVKRSLLLASCACSNNCNWLNGWFYYFAPWISTFCALAGMYHVCRVKYNLALSSSCLSNAAYRDDPISI